MQLPVIDTKRLKLRPLSYEDTEVIYRIFSDREVTRFWGHNTLKNKSEAKRFIKQTITGAEDESLLEWGVVEKDSHALIGVCAYSGWDREHKRAEIGFALQKDRWGQGYMTELMHTFIPFGFRRLQLLRIEADVDPRNKASIRLLEKFGFQREGLLRERYHINGEAQDALFYGLLKHELENSM